MRILLISCIASRVRHPAGPGPCLATALVAVLLAGCTSLTIDAPGTVAGRRTYVGIVTVDAPLHAAPASPASPARGVRQLSVTTLGLRLAEGPSVSLGYSQDRLLSIPADCRLVIFIRSSTDLAHAERLLRTTTQENLCSATLPE